MRYLYIILLLFGLSGCVTPVNSVTYLDEAGVLVTKDFDEILREYFTDEAYEAIKDIPLADSAMPLGGKALAAGTSVWSNIASFLTFNGWGRKVLMNLDEFQKDWGIEYLNGYNLVVASLVHEYVHQLDDMTRSGDVSFIDINEWKEGYERCFADSQYHSIVRWVEKMANGFIENTFGVGEYSEHIAYMAGYIAITDLDRMPEYILRPYRKILRKCQ